MEAKLFVESLGFKFTSFVKIDDIPFLVVLTMRSMYSNSLSFFILGSNNIKYLIVHHVNELIILILEDLEPL
jgi:hypothetical protein